MSMVQIGAKTSQYILRECTSASVFTPSPSKIFTSIFLQELMQGQLAVGDQNESTLSDSFLIFAENVLTPNVAPCLSHPIGLFALSGPWEISHT